MALSLSAIKAYIATPSAGYIRAVLYVAIPAWLLELVTAGKLAQDRADLVTAVVLAALGPALAAVFAPNGWRTYLYSLAAPVQGLLVGIGGVTHNALGMLAIAILGSVVTSGLAASNVHRPKADGQ